MLEQDYLAANKNKAIEQYGLTTKAVESAAAVNAMSSAIIKEIVIPALEKEVNTGKNFSKLRQVYQSLILATWYKHNLKESILTKVYADRSKTLGVNIDDKTVIQKIYQQYLNAYKKGVYNYIKEERDPLSNQTIPRKYFSGGLQLGIAGGVQQAMVSQGQRVSQAMVSPALLTVEANAVGGRVGRLLKENDPVAQGKILRQIAKSRIIKSNPRTQVEKTTVDQLMVDVYKRLSRDSEVFPQYPVLGRQNISPVVYVLVDENRPEGTFQTILKNGNDTTIVVVNSLNNIDERLKTLKGVDQVPFYIAVQYVPLNLKSLRWLALLLPLMLASSIGLNTPSYAPPIIQPPAIPGERKDKPNNDNKPKTADSDVPGKVLDGLKDKPNNENKPKTADSDVPGKVPDGLKDKPSTQSFESTSIDPRGVYQTVLNIFNRKYPEDMHNFNLKLVIKLLNEGRIIEITKEGKIVVLTLRNVGRLDADPYDIFWKETQIGVILPDKFDPRNPMNWSDKASTSKNGGIDLEKINIDATRQGAGVKTAFNDPAMLKMLQNAQGLKAVVTDLKPLTMPMVNMILGFNNKDVPVQSADSKANKIYIPKIAWIDEKLRKILV